MECSILKLMMVQGPREGETLEFKPGTGIRIGRVVRGNTLPIKDAGISTMHLSVDFESGKWVIRDLDSSNGTLLNNSKLSPFTPFDLRDGDAIKIGECTSIEVKIENKIEDDGESRLRRNPRRGLTVKNGVKGLIKEDCDEKKMENAGPVVENWGRRVGTRRGKGLKEENKEAEFGNVGSVVENQGRRVGAKRDRGFREDDTAVDLDLVGGKCDGELEDVVVVTKSKRGRGRPKKVQVLKNEGTDDLYEVHNLEGKEDASPGVEKLRQQVSLNEEKLVSDSMLQKISKSSCLDYRELEFEDKRAKRNLESEASEVVEIDVEEEKGLEAVEIVASEEKGNVEGLDLGRDMCKESASGSGVEESFIEVNDEVDLEKMTFGEWFDYLEAHMPKQICKVTEEMIANMREKAARFLDFMVQQQNEKGKLPVG